MKTSTDLKVKLFADGADKATMLDMYANPLIQGFTTNPTLMRKAAITDYEGFAKEILAAIPDRPPTAAFTDPPGPAMAGGRATQQTRMAWLTADDYGVAALVAELRLRDRLAAPPVRR